MDSINRTIRKTTVYIPGLANRVNHNYMDSINKTVKYDNCSTPHLSKLG